MIDLNDVATSNPRHDLAAVRDRLAITANDWLPRLFPEAQLARDRRALRCADLSGRAPGRRRQPHPGATLHPADVQAQFRAHGDQ
jgi:hypothetical protein